MYLNLIIQGLQSIRREMMTRAKRRMRIDEILVKRSGLWG